MNLYVNNKNKGVHRNYDGKIWSFFVVIANDIFRLQKYLVRMKWFLLQIRFNLFIQITDRCSEHPYFGRPLYNKFPIQCFIGRTQKHSYKLRRLPSHIDDLSSIRSQIIIWLCQCLNSICVGWNMWVSLNNLGQVNLYCVHFKCSNRNWSNFASR